VHGIVPPFLLEAIAANGTPSQQGAALQTLALDAQIRSDRVSVAGPTTAVAPPQTPPCHEVRTVYSTNNTYTLPGTLVRSEGQPPVGDAAVDEAYDGFGDTFDLYCDVYARNSVDGAGGDLVGTVHYAVRYNNAFWNGTQMVFGDGDGETFRRFTIAVDVIGHELTHGVIDGRLDYQGQSGALNESIADVFGSLVKQRTLGQTAAQADWLIGAGLFEPGIHGVALRSMAAPGTAYDDPVLGKDPQPDSMAGYVTTTDDNGGVHTNSGIPNRAFCLAAKAIGGFAWEQAGQVWYHALVDGGLPANADFQQFATLTAGVAEARFGTDVRDLVVGAWGDVGVSTAASG
jgi:Zn-dependent metalloprotease